MHFIQVVAHRRGVILLRAYTQSHSKINKENQIRIFLPGNKNHIEILDEYLENREMNI